MDFIDIWVIVLVKGRLVYFFSSVGLPSPMTASLRCAICIHSVGLTNSEVDLVTHELKSADEWAKILKVMYYSAGSAPRSGVSGVVCVLEVLIGAVASIIQSHVSYF